MQIDDEKIKRVAESMRPSAGLGKVVESTQVLAISHSSIDQGKE